MNSNERHHVLLLILIALCVTVTLSSAADKTDAVMYGTTPDRNMISPGKGVPTTFDPATGLNVKW